MHMKKIIIFLFTFIGIVSCSINRHNIVSKDKHIENSADSLILQPSTQQPIIDRIQHASHSSHASHFSHYSHYSSL